jgi:hypothetical protein
MGIADVRSSSVPTVVTIVQPDNMDAYESFLVSVDGVHTPPINAVLGNSVASRAVMLIRKCPVVPEFEEFSFGVVEDGWFTKRTTVEGVRTAKRQNLTFLVP